MSQENDIIKISRKDLTELLGQATEKALEKHHKKISSLVDDKVTEILQPYIVMFNDNIELVALERRSYTVMKTRITDAEKGLEGIKKELKNIKDILKTNDGKDKLTSLEQTVKSLNIETMAKKSKDIDEEFNKIQFVHDQHEQEKSKIIEKVKDEIKALVPELQKTYSQIVAEPSPGRASTESVGLRSAPNFIRKGSTRPHRLQVWGRADSSNQLVPDIPRNYLIAVSKIPKHVAYTNEWLMEETKEKLKENNYDITVMGVSNIDSSYPEARTRTVKMHLQCDGKLDPKTLYDERIWVKGLFVKQYRAPRNQNSRGPLNQNNNQTNNSAQAQV